MPALRADALRGGIRYFDAQVDDSRFAVALARTAAAHGAVCAAAVRAAAILRHGGRVTRRAVAQDVESEREFEVRARVVVNATGVWTTETERLAGVERPLLVRPSKGIHLVVPKDRIDSAYALILPTEKSVLFVLPWGDHWIIGTTDTEWRLHLDHPAANRADIEYLLGHVNAVLARPLDARRRGRRVRGPAPAGERRPHEDTTRVSREHEVRRSAPGFVSVVGGKYTTYRIMARDAVDAAVRELSVPGRRQPDRRPAAPRCGRDCRRPRGARPRTPAPPASTPHRSGDWSSAGARWRSRCST